MTIKEIKDRIYQDFISSFKNAITPLRKSVFETFSYALASSFNLLYIFLQRVLNDSFLTTCTRSRLLNYFAPLKGLEQKKATKSTGTVRFYGNDGAVIPAGTQLIYNSNQNFITTASGTINSGYVDIACESIETGEPANTLDNIDLVLAVSVVGVQNACFSFTGFSGAIDDETVEGLRTRTRIAFGMPTRIDNEYYYKTQALKMDNVKAAFVSSIKNGAGTCGITILTYSNNGVPLPQDILNLENYFYDNSLVPSYIQIDFFIPNITYLDFEIQLIINDLSNQDRVQKLITDYLYLYQKPGITFKYSYLNKFLQNHGARLNVPSPLLDYTPSKDEILDIGNIIWS